MSLSSRQLQVKLEQIHLRWQHLTHLGISRCNPTDSFFISSDNPHESDAFLSVTLFRTYLLRRRYKTFDKINIASRRKKKQNVCSVLCHFSTGSFSIRIWRMNKARTGNQPKKSVSNKNSCRLEAITCPSVDRRLFTLYLYSVEKINWNRKLQTALTWIKCYLIVDNCTHPSL